MHLPNKNYIEKISQRWYFGIVLLPILINLFTNSLGLPDILKEIKVTIITSLCFTVIILIYEIYLMRDKIKLSEYNPKRSDKLIIKKLLKTLDIDVFYSEIYNQDSWYGYKSEAIGNILSFIEKAKLLSNKTSDQKLNWHLVNLTESLDDFCHFSSKELFGIIDGWYSPAKDRDFNIEKAKLACPVMNEKAKNAYIKLEILMNYLKVKNYLE